MIDRAHKVGGGVAASGFLLQLVAQIFEVAGNFSPVQLLWSWLPYIVCLLVLVAAKNPIIPFAGTVAVLLLDSVFFFLVLVEGRGSFTPLSSSILPVWNLVLVMPAGMLVGWGFVRGTRSKNNAL